MSELPNDELVQAASVRREIYRQKNIINERKQDIIKAKKIISTAESDIKLAKSTLKFLFDRSEKYNNTMNNGKTEETEEFKRHPLILMR